MVTKLIKFLFVTNSAPSAHFPDFSELLPTQLQNQYEKYYLVGTGASIFFIFLAGIILFALFSNKSFLRLFAKIIVTLTLLLWPTSQNLRVVNTDILLNLLFLPIPRIPASFFFILFFITVGFAYQFVRNLCSQYCQRKIVLLCDFTIFCLLLMFFLPYWSGELF